MPGGVPGPGGGFAPRGCTWSWGVSAQGVSAPGGCLLWEGVYLVPGVSALGGVCSLGGVPGPGAGVPAPGGCQVLPPVNRMTNRCKNITLPQTSFAGGKYLDCRVIDRHIILKVKLLPPANIYGKVMFSEAFVCPQGERALCMRGSLSVGSLSRCNSVLMEIPCSRYIVEECVAVCKIQHFYAYDLGLNPMTLIFNLDLDKVKMYLYTQNEVSM